MALDVHRNRNGFIRDGTPFENVASKNKQMKFSLSRCTENEYLTRCSHADFLSVVNFRFAIADIGSAKVNFPINVTRRGGRMGRWNMNEQSKPLQKSYLSGSMSAAERRDRKRGVLINWRGELLAAAPINHPDSNMKSSLNFILLCSIVIKLPPGLLGSQRPAATRT